MRGGAKVDVGGAGVAHLAPSRALSCIFKLAEQPLCLLGGGGVSGGLAYRPIPTHVRLLQCFRLAVFPASPEWHRKTRFISSRAGGASRLPHFPYIHLATAFISVHFQLRPSEVVY